MTEAVTDLRIGHIGHGLGTLATLSYDDSILTKNLRNCAEATSQFTLKLAEMQMSTLVSYQYSNNTTVLCIWA